MNKVRNPIVFRRNVDIGAADAEADDAYLSQCFVDTGDLSTMLDCGNARSLVLGRTGSGKTALLKAITRDNDKAVQLSPEDLALNYVANSSVLGFFEAAGVSLDIFYALLWRHIITVELLKLKYSITDPQKQFGFLDSISVFLQRDRAKDRALKYLRDWGGQFWQETEYRTKEFTRKLESDLKASSKINAHYVELGAEGAQKLSEEEKFEVRDSGSRIVNNVQVKDLHDVISLLADNIFNDEGQRYYIVIDRLDEDWVDDRIKSKLIKALIEAVRSFRKVQSVKIVVALRTDLYNRVLQQTASSGFQEEKYKSLYLNIKWSREHIRKVLDRRVTAMFKRQYTQDPVPVTEILPSNQIDQKDALDYILDRTFLRPREAIIFLNECISRSEGKSKITPAVLRSAETSYSRERLVSLADEWRADLPNLQRIVAVLSGLHSPFLRFNMDKSTCERAAFAVLENNQGKDEIYEICNDCFLEEKISFDAFYARIIVISYRVGIVGVKLAPHLSRQWSYLDEPVLHSDQINDAVQCDVHKTFWAILGITKRSKRSKSVSQDNDIGEDQNPRQPSE